MTLPAPNLDDRTAQELVDEAKRRIQAQCPEWTDHNVSDPGVMLIELFAWMTEQTIYRLNQVPERLYVKFLDLLGVERRPPRAARADITFWLAGPQPSTVRVPLGTEVATIRTARDEALTFTLVERLEIVPCALAAVGVAPRDGDAVQDRTADLRAEKPLSAFQEPPEPGNALYVRLSAAVPRCAVTLRFDCNKAFGGGIDPLRPPLLWECVTEKGWKACRFTDGTRGLNVPGDVVVHVPREVADGPTQLRCRLLASRPGEPTYESSPSVEGLSAFTSGGYARAVHAEGVENEPLGRSNGLPGQRFKVVRPPIVPTPEPLVIEADGQEWVKVDTFAGSSDEDRHFTVDAVAGEIAFGPGVRVPGESKLRCYGAIPPGGAELRLRAYLTGGGPAGNVEAKAIRVLKSAIPLIARVENLAPAEGGAAGESVEEACVRGPLALRRADRAVTAEDYERLTREASDRVGRVRCLPAGADGGVARVIVVPQVEADAQGRRPRAALDAFDGVREEIERYLEPRRMLGARFVVQPPTWVGVRVDASFQPLPGVDAEAVAEAATEALYRYFDPLTGGPQGTGWPFGRAVYEGEASLVVQRVPGVETVQVYLHRIRPTEDPERVQRIALPPDGLVVSVEHGVEPT